MSTSALIPVEEYLRTIYEPDAEYVDGELVERNVGEFDHSRLQSLIDRALGEFEKSHKLCVLVEQRMRVADTATRKRYRIPDVLVLVRPFRKTPVLLEPPAMVIEILSPDDRMSMMLVKVADYENFGIQCILVIDPAQQVLFKAEAGGLIPVPDCTVRLATATGEISVDLKPLFAELDAE